MFPTGRPESRYTTQSVTRLPTLSSSRLLPRSLRKKTVRAGCSNIYYKTRTDSGPCTKAVICDEGTAYNILSYHQTHDIAGALHDRNGSFWNCSASTTIS